MKQKKLKAVLSCLLSACLPLSMMGASSAYAITPDEEPPAPTGVNTPESFVLPDIVSAAEAEENGYIGRDYTAEHDLSTFVFKNEDGTGTMRVYSHPVKYYDERGKVRDISLDLAKDADGKIVTAKNNIKTAFPEVLSEGIALSHEDIDLLMVPITDNANAVAEFDEKARTVSYRIDDRTAYVYGLTYTGFKEDIVVSEYTGQTDYRFTLYTNGLALKEDDGVFMLTDKEGEPTAYLSDIVVYTADGGNNTVGAMNCEAVVENEQYALTVHLDEDYLRDEATVYPIRIDPSVITVSGSSGINAKCLYNNNASSNNLLYVGKYSIYKTRTFLGFPTIGEQMEIFSSSLNILEATVEVYDVAQRSQAINVYCYQFNGNWYDNSNGNPTWSSLNQDGTGESAGIYTLLDSRTVGSLYGAGLTVPNRYSFNVTQAVKRWKEQHEVLMTAGDAFLPQEGIVFKAGTAIEGSSSACYTRFAPVQHTTQSPSLEVNFTYNVHHNMFYSKYDPDRMTKSETDHSYLSGALRQNCYGYALGHIVYTDCTSVYKQIPGEFASNGNISNVYSNNVINSTNDAVTRMNYIVHNMSLDAARLGYTMTEYTPTYNNDYVVEQFGTDSRLIAVVTGSTDFHFYMQNSDGTWSHKPGGSNERNISLSNGYILTNDNIYYRANEGSYQAGNAGGYAEGKLKFFVITRYGLWDYPHTNSCFASSHTGSAWPNCGHSNLLAKIIPYREKAGDYFENAVSLGAPSNSVCFGRMDYPRDRDVFTFYVNDTNIHTFTVTCAGVVPGYQTSNVQYSCTIYTNKGTPVASANGTVSVTISKALSPDTLYHISIEEDSQTCSVYQLSLV